MVPSVVLNLLTAICASEYQESAVINTLNDRYSFDHNVILLDSSADINRFINVERQVPLTPQSVFVHKNDPTQWNNFKQIRSTNPFTIVGFGKFRPKTIRNEFASLLDRVIEIQRLKLNMKIGLFFADSISYNDLLELFKWFFGRRIISIFVACYGESSESMNVLEVFSFNPFGTFRVLNITDTNYDNIFLSQNSNFQRYPLNVTYGGRIYYDPLLRTIFQGMNASYNLVSSSSTSWIDFDTDRLEPIGETNVLIYPIFKDKTVMIVPKSKPYPKFLAYLQLFASTNVFMYIIFTIVLTIVLLTLIRYKGEKNTSIFQSGSEILYLLMNENGFIRYQLRSFPEVSLLVPLTFAGFIFTNGFMSVLQSYLIQPVMQPQINTLEDIYKSDILIYPQLNVLETALDNMFRNLTIYNGPKKVGQGHYQSRILRFFSGIFPESENFWKEKEQAEEKLDVRGFHVSEVYLQESLYSYRVNDAFAFADRMNDIINQLQGAGLIERWTRFTDAAPFTDDVKDRERLLRENVIHEYLTPIEIPSTEELKILFPNTWKKEVDQYREMFPQNSEETSFDFPMFVFYGWGVSAAVFFMEILYHFWLSKIIALIQRGFAAGLNRTKRKFQLSKERIFHSLRKL